MDDRPAYDRRRDDVGNVLALEHVNVTVPDQSTATLFYVNTLGFTRDPYMDFGPRNVWVNVGQQQFHLPTGQPQVLRGRVGVVLPDLEDLTRRLQRMTKPLAGTRFAWQAAAEHIDVTCPWGNAIRCHGPGDGFGDMRLGIPYVELDVPAGTAAGICRFYNDVLGAPASLATRHGRPATEVRIGTRQRLWYVESVQAVPAYDGHHIAIYVVDFSGPHRRLLDRSLVTEESDAHQYRFARLIDPLDGAELFQLEHEVRSLHHPMFQRPLVNRNPAQAFSNYQRGHDAFYG